MEFNLTLQILLRLKIMYEWCCCKKRIQIKDRKKLNENIRVEETREIIEDFIKNTINKSASSEKNNHE